MISLLEFIPSPLLNLLLFPFMNPTSPLFPDPTLTPEAAYEADRLAYPFHHDGTARALWADLGDIARESWMRNPTPRNWAPAAPCPSSTWLPAPVGVAVAPAAFQAHPAYLPAPVVETVPSLGAGKLPALPLRLTAGLIVTDANGVDIAASMSPTDTLHGEKCFGLRKQYMGGIVSACNAHAALVASLAVLTLDSKIRAFLEANDPQALRQAVEALAVARGA